jgi:hypothetical protein
MHKNFETKSIEDIIDRVAADPAQASDAKRALRKLVVAREPVQMFEHEHSRGLQTQHRPRRRVAEIDDDLFDNMPV